jgi:NTE family protein
MAQMQDYLNAAQPSLDRVKAFYKDRELVVSDVVDVHGNQYVNLVQEGGGVLGVALVGYTYILEQMGIRFMKMAGTSAGAINTMVLACLGGKEEEKSIKVLELIAKKNFFDFVDGHPSAKYAIRNLITSKSFARNVTVALIILVIALIVSLLVFMFQLGRDTQDFWYWFGVAFFTATWRPPSSWPSGFFTSTSAF